MCLGMVDARRGDGAAAAAQETLCREKFPDMSSYQLAMLGGARRDRRSVLAELTRLGIECKERKAPVS